MEISTTNIATNTATQPTVGAASQNTDDSDGTVITSDFEAFLRLLTTQLQNQDPLNPLDSADFATQLATFSGVEQQVRTNTLLSDLQGNLALIGMGQMAGWIGMEARAQIPATFSGNAITLAADPPATADRVELVVSNSGGQEVQRLAISNSTDPTSWTGLGADGETLPYGQYSFNIESYRGDELLEVEAASVFSVVREAFQRGNETWLTLEGGQEVLATDVLGVRSPSIASDLSSAAEVARRSEQAAQ